MRVGSQYIELQSELVQEVGKMPSKFFVPTGSAEEWKRLLAKPEKHWRTGYSAKALAYCWQEANGFPADVRRAFRNSKLELFQDIGLLVAFPEYRVSLPPRGGLPTQCDIFILAKKNDQLVSMAVEGKVSEPFGDTVADWKAEEGKGKPERLRFLCNLMGLEKAKVEQIRYQLLHRTAAALIEATEFNALSAVMMVHSFSQDYQGFDDYCRFLNLFGVNAKRDSLKDSLVYAKKVNGIRLYFGWVKGNTRYLAET
jgi:hypothetical protein